MVPAPGVAVAVRFEEEIVGGAIEALDPLPGLPRRDDLVDVRFCSVAHVAPEAEHDRGIDLRVCGLDRQVAGIGPGDVGNRDLLKRAVGIEELRREVGGVNGAFPACIRPVQNPGRGNLHQRRIAGLIREFHLLREDGGNLSQTIGVVFRIGNRDLGPAAGGCHRLHGAGGIGSDVKEVDDVSDRGRLAGRNVLEAGHHHAIA